MTQTVHLGYAVGTGEPVEVPIAHTFITGQTQLSGKTTALRALVERSGRRALAFVTKRGERFDGRRVPPYLPREGERPIHWRLVETILASALGQRALKYERLWIVNAAKGAKSLADVRRNVDRLKAKAKGNTADVYMLIGEYLDLVLPEMQALAASDVLDLQPGLNVMDLGGAGPQLQALVIRAALERVNQHERGVLTVFPEAWEFAPRGRAAPAKDEAIAMARKGAVLGNFLLCDSQDIAGVDTVVRQAASVWILGVQRELNELKRTIDSIPAGIAKPKSADVATLGLGQFYACWGRHAVKVYVQPAGMDPDVARAVAEGVMDLATAAAHTPAISNPVKPALQTRTDAATEAPAMTPSTDQKIDTLIGLLGRFVAGGQQAQAAADQAIAESPKRPVVSVHGGCATSGESPAPSGWSRDDEALYQRFKARLIDEAPALLQVLVARPEVQVKVERRVIEAAGDSLQGRLALLIKGGWFDDGQTGYAAWKELVRLGSNPAKVSVYTELKNLAKLGFLTKEGGEGKELYKAVAAMKGSVK